MISLFKNALHLPEAPGFLAGVVILMVVFA